VDAADARAPAPFARCRDGRPATAAAATPYGLLVECPHGLLGHGAGQVAAAAGKGNVPRARNFAGAGYPVTQERVNFV
jgi:hypothetical protein